LRLWHQALIKNLPDKQLLGQHRELCGLRGKGLGRKHSTVDYVFKYSIYRLFIFHLLVIAEMQNRGFKIDKKWLDCNYRGKILGIDKNIKKKIIKNKLIYKEHNLNYLQECLQNLQKKGVKIK